MAVIYRDEYGVPHIDAKNYCDATKAIGYCHCEDDFYDIQLLLLAGKQKSGHHDDWDGPYLDMVCAYFNIPAHVQRLPPLSPSYMELLKSYSEGVNRYAKEHPKEVLDKSMFPIDENDVIVTQHLMEVIGIQLDKPYSYLKDSNEMSLPTKEGSNVIAIGPKISSNGHTLIAISPHQTIEGPFSYYEIHVHSEEENIDFHGFILPCTFTIFMGTNFKIAWGATANYPEMYNVYEIDIEKDSIGSFFLLNSEKVRLDIKQYKNYTKLYGKIPFPIYKRMYSSKYGNIIEINGKFYLIDIPMLGQQLGFEQNYKLSLCNNCKQALEQLKKAQYTYLDFVLTDDIDNLLYVHCCKEKRRNSTCDFYKNTLPQTSVNEIDGKNYYDANNMVVVENPECSFIVSVNQSPFRVTDTDLYKDSYMGLIYRNDNSRSIRVKELLNKLKPIGKEELKYIQFDTKIIFPIIRNIDFSALQTIDGKKFPKLESLIKELQGWDGNATIDSRGAAIFAMLFHRYKRFYRYSKNPDVIKVASEKELINCLRWTDKHLSPNAKLGDIQYLKRGKQKFPIGGIPDSINTVRPYYEKGKLYVEEASAFRMIIDLSSKNTYSCHPLGVSSNEDSSNYTNQMELFVNNEYRIIEDITYYKHHKGYKI